MFDEDYHWQDISRVEGRGSAGVSLMFSAEGQLVFADGQNYLNHTSL